MNRTKTLLLAVFALLSCALVAHALTVKPNVGPVVTNPIPGSDQYVQTTRIIDLTQFFGDPDSSAAARMVTPLGSITITLDGAQTPQTVANFVNYINTNRYFTIDPTTGERVGSFIHRSAASGGVPFVIQGGGFIATVNPNDPANAQPTAVLTYPAVPNEPFISNTRGTIAMAKLGGNPNSATSQWFINMNDNSANLDNQNGGFTVFGHVTGDGMDVANAIAALPKVNASTTFSELPVRDYTSPNPIKVANLVTIPELTLVSPLTYSATSDNPNVATATVSDGKLLVNALALGTANITVTGYDLDGAGPVSQTFAAHVISAPGRLRNISTRINFPHGDDVLISGFIVRGGTHKQLIIRGLGPSLAGTVPNTISDPTLEVRDGDGALLASNDNWIDSPDKQLLSDINLAPGDNREAAILIDVPSNATNATYTAIVRSKGNLPGVGLVEVFELDSGAGANILNLSTRGAISGGDNVMIAGFISQGTDQRRLILRALGPSLTDRGVPDVLPDPILELRDAQGNLVESNDDWQTSPGAAEISGYNLAPGDPHESALVRTLDSGTYTAIVRGTAASPAGTALVEIYQVQ